MKKQAIITLAEIRKMANQSAIKSLPEFSKAVYEIFNRADLKGFVIELQLTTKTTLNKPTHAVNVAIIDKQTGELRSFDTTRILKFENVAFVLGLPQNAAIKEFLFDKQVFTAKQVRNTNARIFESEYYGLEILVSYETIVAIANYSGHCIYLRPDCWDYSSTTSRHVSQFLARFSDDWRVYFAK